MRKLIALFTLSIVVAGGCSGGDGPPQLEPLARGLSDAMQPAYADLRLEIRALNKGDRIILHCVLRNVSIAASAIDVDASTLPWRNTDFFEIDAVTANGKVVQRSPWPIELGPISALPSPLTVASGKEIEGDMYLREMPISGLPTNEDLLLLWSTSIRVFNSETATELRGVTFLKATSAIAGGRSSPKSPEVPKMTSGSSSSETSGSPLMPDEPWFNPLGGTWTPDAAIVSEMKIALDSALRQFLSARGKATQPERYWFQYLGHGSGSARTIDIRGRPFPVLPRADTKAYFGPWFPEDCIVHARYVPSQRRIEDLIVGGFCPLASDNRWMQIAGWSIHTASKRTLAAARNGSITETNEDQTDDNTKEPFVDGRTFVTAASIAVQISKALPSVKVGSRRMWGE
jgi:hypothetical protein